MMEQIQKVRERIAYVKNNGWQVLDLKNCGLTEIPHELFSYPHLISIDLSNDDFCDVKSKNVIREIPSDIKKLTNLVRLNLANNKVNKVSEELSKLSKLHYLNLKSNQLTDLAFDVANMDGLKQLHIEDNPFEMLPPEIVARGVDSIRNFYKELEEKDFLYEVKLIIVGEGRVGKTCLSQALLNPNFRLGTQASTEGININSWIIPQQEIAKINPKIQRDFQINIWDFGGQEIYHSTHQFFLTKRSMYMLVTESRKEDSHDDFFYWLNIIKLLGDRSPVVMVLNKCDQPTKELPIKEYKESFANIIDFQKVSLQEGFEKSIFQFREKLKQIASNLPHIGTPLPKKWVDIRREIEVLKLSGKNYITEIEYLEICKKHYRNVESALFLSEYFHDLGVLLHFKDDIDLKDTVILNHEWITSGVYKILDDRIVIENKGRFKNEDLKRIWANEDYKLKIRELISLMKNKKFDLCFEIGNGEYLVPRLLPVDEIDHNWESSSDALKFEFQYKFMPKGILARLIVKLSSDIFNNMYWRYGVLLQYDDTRAIVKEKYFESKITIELIGKSKREYLFTIRKAIKEIHKDFNRLEVKEMVPCNCKDCKNSGDPIFFDYNYLQRLAYANIRNARCTNSLEEVDVFDLTSDIIKSVNVTERLIICENKNADLLKLVGFENIFYFPEKDSSSVFMQIKTRGDRFGLRDRDFLLDSEIERIKLKYPNYFILDYYCFENYLYHPDNISELKLDDFNKSIYTKEICRQKNQSKNHIISIFRTSRSTYQEFKIQEEKIRDKENEGNIYKYLDSDDIEIFYKSYSMKDYFNKECLAKYNLRHEDLVQTEWFKHKLNRIFDFKALQ